MGKKADSPEAFGKRVARLRDAAGLSQPALAEKCGVPLSTLRQWEQGWRVPSLASALQLADGLAVTVDSLARDADLTTRPRGEDKS